MITRDVIDQLKLFFHKIEEEGHPDNKCLPSGADMYEFLHNSDRTNDHLRSIAQDGSRFVEDLEWELFGEKE